MRFKNIMLVSIAATAVISAIAIAAEPGQGSIDHPSATKEEASSAVGQDKDSIDQSGAAKEEAGTGVSHSSDPSVDQSNPPKEKKPGVEPNTWAPIFRK